MADTLVNIAPTDPTLAAIILQNRERIAVLETRQKEISCNVDKAVTLIGELHEDMVGRKAVRSISERLMTYLGWAIAGVGALFGISQSNVALHWLSSIPAPGH